MGEGHPLPEVLARADRYLTGELGDGFATVIISSYDSASGELRWAKAGHEPPIVSGQPDAPEEAATPLGLGFGDRWPEFRRGLAPGERVCLFTDGLVEARRGGTVLGRGPLKALVEEGLDAPAIVERIERDADSCGDDLAAVVVSRASDGAPTGVMAANRAAR
jgi:serine phosphatase RsbU (regulator of sigma subunit)